MDVPRRKKSYAQRYRSEWESYAEFKDWLKPVAGDSTKAQCLYCRTEFYAKIGDIKKHSSTKKHQQRSGPLTSAQRRIDFQPAQDDPSFVSARKAEATLAMFVAEHCSLNSTDHLVEACKTAFPDSKTSTAAKLHRTKCTEILNEVLAPHFLKALVEDIGDQNFSLIIDESTDISVSKQLGVVVKFPSPKQSKIVSTFLVVKTIECGTARVIAEAVVDTVKSAGLRIERLVGIGTDNASVMTGVNNGVYRILKEEHNLPHLVLVPCACHSIQLAVSHASEETIPRNIEFLIRETYNWFAMSPTRKCEYQNVYETINCGEQPLKILKVSATRWLSIQAAVSRILGQWEELKLHFGLARTKSNCYTAHMLFSMYSDPQNRLYLIYLNTVLQDAQYAMKAFEAEGVDPTKLLVTLTTLIQTVGSRVAIPGTHNDYLSTTAETLQLNPAPYLGYTFESAAREARLSPDDEENLRSRCVQFTVKLVTQLRQRLPENVKILTKVSELSADNTLKANKSLEVVDLAKHFGYDGETIDRILSQWRCIHFHRWENTSDTVQFWSEVKAYKDAAGQNPYSDLCALAMTVLSLPYSNAEVERVFSAMNIVKCKLRNRMALKTLNAILTVRMGLKRMGTHCFSYDVPRDVLRLIGSRSSYATAAEPQPSTSSADCSVVVTDDEDDSVFLDD